MPENHLDARIRELFAELDAVAPEAPPRPVVARTPTKRWLQVGLPAVASAVVVLIAAVVIALPSEDSAEDAAGETTTTVLAAPDTTEAAAETTTTAVGEEQPPLSGVAFVEDWQVQRGEIVAYGPDGATIIDRIEGVERPLTSDGIANLVAGPWGLVYQPEIGDLSRETTAPIWWISTAGTEPSLVFEGDGDQVMQLYEVVVWNGLEHAVVRVEIDQDNDLWLLVPLDGGETVETGTFGGGDVTTPCVAWDGEALYLATIGTAASQVITLAVDGDWSAFLPGGPGDAWSGTSCITTRADGGFVVVVDEGPNEEGIDPPPRLLVLLDSSGEIDSTLVLSDMGHAVWVDATDGGVVLLAETENASYWLNHEEGDSPVPLNTIHPFARFVD